MATVEKLREDKYITQARYIMDFSQRIPNIGAASGNAKLRVCDICGALLSVVDSEVRLADHFGGRIHQGYLLMKHALQELKVRREKREAYILLLFNRLKHKDEPKKDSDKTKKEKSETRKSEKDDRQYILYYFSRSRSHHKHDRSRSRSNRKHHRSRSHDRSRSNDRNRGKDYKYHSSRR